MNNAFFPASVMSRHKTSPEPPEMLTSRSMKLQPVNLPQPPLSNEVLTSGSTKLQRVTLPQSPSSNEVLTSGSTKLQAVNLPQPPLLNEVLTSGNHLNFAKSPVIYFSGELYLILVFS